MKLFDAHCDTLYEGCLKNIPLLDGILHISLERGLAYAPWCQVFAIFIPDQLHGDEALKHFDRCRDYLEEQMGQCRSLMRLCRTAEDMEEAAKAGQCAAILSVEGGAAVGGKLERLRYLYDRDVRLLTLTWNGRDEIADGVLVPDAGGLTPFGYEAVELCQQLGIVVDVSHLAEKGFWDVEQCMRLPYVASHSNAKPVCGHVRNLTDRQFEAIRNRGGLVGLNFCPAFLRNGEDAVDGQGTATMEDIEHHLAHFLALGGEDVVCLGTDFDGAPMPQDIHGIEDLERLYLFLEDKGYSKRLLDKVFFQNGWDFFQNALTGAL